MNGGWGNLTLSPSFHRSIPFHPQNHELSTTKILPHRLAGYDKMESENDTVFDAIA
jgi:hypothetical protein